MTRNRFIWGALSLLLILQACKKEDDTVDYQPISEFTVSPESGNTTTIFSFDASASLKYSLEDNPLFLRWDWDSDGKWDKMYTTGGEYTHRFFQKGTYTVKLESASLLGRKDTSEITLVIEQGYSTPRPIFTVTPDSANIFTEFIFDASGSKDDEDSLDLLQFRWDFEGDKIWDSEFSSNPIIKHTYTNDRDYPVTLEVKDPQDMRGIAISNHIVTRLNDSIVPIIKYECWPCTLEDTIYFDASDSYLIDDPDAILQYSWDVQNDNVWEGIHNVSPLFKYIIRSEGVYEIKLRVTDSKTLYMDTVCEIEIFPFNTPPVVELVVANPYGNTSSEYYLHGLGSWDRETSYFNRKLQWDLNGDGIWEEEHTDNYEVWTKYDKPGKYPITLKITDEQGKSTEAYDTIFVFNGTRQTGLMQDRRGGSLPEYYGTVKIGSTWWTQNNSRYQPPQNTPGTYYTYSYMQQDSIKKYGYLYPYNAIVSDFNPCPDGWRIPSVDDWERLMADLAPDNNISDLLYGGSSELHLYLTGQREGSQYKGKGRMVHYYTTTTTVTGHVYLWYIDKLLDKNKSVLSSRMYSLPVRCVKVK